MASSAAKQKISQAFPKLATSVFKLTSKATYSYNCIAFAAGDESRFWWPDTERINYWPPDANREETLQAFIGVFQLFGYEPCDEDCFEEGFEKVALFCKDGTPSHAARSAGGENWKSKLGPSEDIQHKLKDLEGDKYGIVSQILKRESKKRE